MPQLEAGKFFLHGRPFTSPIGVYSPSDDSYLLAESVHPAKGCIAIDMGCGSGIQMLNLLFRGAAKVIALDISEEALQATRENCTAAGFGDRVDVRKSDLFGACPEKADLIVFNPPYIETMQSENQNADEPQNPFKGRRLDKVRESTETMFSDLDGGRKGREVLNRFLAQMPTHLNKAGECYFLQTDLNGYAETWKILTSLGFDFEIVGCKKMFFEEIAIYRCRRKISLLS